MLEENKRRDIKNRTNSGKNTKLVRDFIGNRTLGITPEGELMSMKRVIPRENEKDILSQSPSKQDKVSELTPQEVKTQMNKEILTIEWEAARQKKLSPIDQTQKALINELLQSLSHPIQLHVEGAKLSQWYETNFTRFQKIIEILLKRTKKEIEYLDEKSAKFNQMIIYNAISENRDTEKQNIEHTQPNSRIQELQSRIKKNKQTSSLLEKQKKDLESIQKGNISNVTEMLEKTHIFLTNERIRSKEDINDLRKEGPFEEQENERIKESILRKETKLEFLDGQIDYLKYLRQNELYHDFYLLKKSEADLKKKIGKMQASNTEDPSNLISMLNNIYTEIKEIILIPGKIRVQKETLKTFANPSKEQSFGQFPPGHAIQRADQSTKKLDQDITNYNQTLDNLTTLSSMEDMFKNYIHPNAKKDLEITKLELKNFEEQLSQALVQINTLVEQKNIPKCLEIFMSGTDLASKYRENFKQKLIEHRKYAAFDSQRFSIINRFIELTQPFLEKCSAEQKKDYSRCKIVSNITFVNALRYNEDISRLEANISLILKKELLDGCKSDDLDQFRDSIIDELRQQCGETSNQVSNSEVLPQQKALSDKSPSSTTSMQSQEQISDLNYGKKQRLLALLFAVNASQNKPLYAKIEQAQSAKEGIPFVTVNKVNKNNYQNQIIHMALNQPKNQIDSFILREVTKGD